MRSLRRFQVFSDRDTDRIDPLLAELDRDQNFGLFGDQRQLHDQLLKLSRRRRFDGDFDRD